jgi:hypothetical protein
MVTAATIPGWQVTGCKVAGYGLQIPQDGEWHESDRPRPRSLPGYSRAVCSRIQWRRGKVKRGREVGKLVLEIGQCLSYTDFCGFEKNDNIVSTGAKWLGEYFTYS